MKSKGKKVLMIMLAAVTALTMVSLWMFWDKAVYDLISVWLFQVPKALLLKARLPTVRLLVSAVSLGCAVCVLT